MKRTKLFQKCAAKLLNINHRVGCLCGVVLIKTSIVSSLWDLPTMGSYHYIFSHPVLHSHTLTISQWVLFPVSSLRFYLLKEQKVKVGVTVSHSAQWSVFSIWTELSSRTWTKDNDGSIYIKVKACLRETHNNSLVTISSEVWMKIQKESKKISKDLHSRESHRKVAKRKKV